MPAKPVTFTALALAVPVEFMPSVLVAFALAVLVVIALLFAIVICRATREAEEVGATELEESVSERLESVAETLADWEPESVGVALGSYTSTARLGF